MLGSHRVYHFTFGLTIFLLIVATYLSTWVSPTDFQQGENYRIIYVHVPAAWMSLSFI